MMRFLVNMFNMLLCRFLLSLLLLTQISVLASEFSNKESFNYRDTVLASIQKKSKEFSTSFFSLKYDGKFLRSEDIPVRFENERETPDKRTFRAVYEIEKDVLVLKLM